MNNINNQIEKGDKILAMFTVRGEVIAQVSCDEFTSVEQVISTLRSLSNKYSGLTQMFIRNFTHGWHINTSLYIPRPKPTLSITTSPYQYNSPNTIWKSEH